MLEEINEVTEVVGEVADLVPTKSNGICKKVGIIGGLVAFTGLVTSGIVLLVKRHKKKKAYGVKQAGSDDFYEEEEVEEIDDEEEKEETNKKSKAKSKK